MKSKWTRNQIILAIGVGVSVIAVIVSICLLFIQAQSLEQKIQPIIEMKPEINNIIENIIKVEKEVANINEAMHQYFQGEAREIFRKRDLNNRIKVYESPTGDERILFFELTDVPEDNSVEFSSRSGGVRSFATHTIFNNILVYKTESKAGAFLKGDEDFFSVRYYPKYDAPQEKFTVDGMQYRGTAEAPFESWFPARGKRFQLPPVRK